MIELKLDRGQFEAFDKAITENRPIDPGPDGWTLSALLVLVGQCQAIANNVAESSGRESRTVQAWRQGLAAAAPRRESREAEEARYVTARSDVLAASALCRHLGRGVTRSVDSSYWKGLLDDHCSCEVAWDEEINRATVTWGAGSKGDCEWTVDVVGANLNRKGAVG